jgi:hypothetical protein
MTKKEALKEYNKIAPDNFTSVHEYLNKRDEFYMEHYHLLRKTPGDRVWQYTEGFKGMNKISKINKLVELIKDFDDVSNTPAHNFIIAVTLHRLYKELRKRYKNTSVQNIALLQMLGD